VSGAGLGCGAAAFVAAVALALEPACAARSSGALQGDDIAVVTQGEDAGGDAGTGGPIFTSDAGTGTSVVGADASCATAVAEAKRQPVYLMFVLDGSDSMAQDNKWTAATAALTSIFAQMKTAADPGVGAGLIVFPAGGSPYPGSGDVPLGFVDAAQNAALDTRLMTSLVIGTPTEAAMTGGYGELEGFTPKAPLLTGGKKVLILITDGVPTDGCAGLLGLGNYSSNACVKLAQTKLTEGAPGPVETFVVGVGDFPSNNAASFDPAFLGNVAQAGGTGPKGCNPNEAASTSDLCYFEIDPSTSTTASDLQKKFETALDAIRGQVVSCTFPLKTTGLGPIDPQLVNVEIGGKVTQQDAANGWTYDDPNNPTAIVLHGAACATATGDITAKVDILVGCFTGSLK
jgi:hypothetical protein